MKLSFDIKLLVIIGLFHLLGSNVIQAQESDSFILSGIVTSNKQEKLTGVNVYLKGTINGTVTNEDGYYSLQIPEGTDTIVFSFIGYQTHIHALTQSQGMTTLNITLEPIEALLQEISITSQRKFFGNMDYGRDIPTVKSDEIEKLNSTNASDILHARLAGVWATKTSGAPGDQQKIRIRGQASFFSSAEPLYVIDGVPVPIVNLASLGIGDLNMHDIESVTVLKDASSSSLYGFQGSNGVVLIDTKQRSDNKLNFSYRQGVQWFNNYYDLMNTKDFLESLQLAKENINSSIYKYYPEFSDTLCDHNRQDEIFQMGNLKEYQLSGGGKLKNTSYYLSGNYTKHTGILKGSEQDKYNFTARIGTTIKNKLAISGSYRWSYQENLNNQNKYMGDQLIFEGIPKAPCLECTPDEMLQNDDRSSNKLNVRTHSRYELLNSLTTPEQIMENNFHSYNFSSNAASLSARYNISENISVNLMESMMQRNSEFTYKSIFNKVEWVNLFNTFYYSEYKVNMASDESIVLLNHQINLTYNKIIDSHQLDISIANRYYTDNILWKVDTLIQQIPEGYYALNSMAGVSSKGSVIRKIGSSICHLSYNYAKKYFISAIANISRIREGLFIDYYTIFPSLSLSWNLANEPFINGYYWLNALDIYVNYGTSGNYPLNGFANDTYEKVRNFNKMFDESHLILKHFSNHKLQHESNTEFNIGLKSSFFDQRLTINQAYFSKKIGNQIIQRDIPLYYSGGKMFINLGDIHVNGFDFGFEVIPIKSKDLELILSGNYSNSRQKVTLLADHQDMQFISEDLLFPDFIIKEGQAMGDFYGYKCFGKWTEQDQINQDINYVNVDGYKFFNADTTNRKLDVNDKTVIGNSTPKFNWNLMSSFTYKELGIDLTFYSVWGMQKYNATRATTFITGVNREVNQLYADSTSLIKNYAFYQSSLFVEDASFIRLKSATFIYAPSKKLLGINYKISLSLENFWTHTNYKGYDPEATIYTDNNFSDNAIDKGAYPNPRSFFATINFTF